MPMKRGAREASSMRAKRKGELTEKRETERMEVTTVVADASTPSSLSSTVLAWRTLVTFRGWSEIPERLGPENREPRPDSKRKRGQWFQSSINLITLTLRIDTFRLLFSRVIKCVMLHNMTTVLPFSSLEMVSPPLYSHPCWSALPGAPGGTVASP